MGLSIAHLYGDAKWTPSGFDRAISCQYLAPWVNSKAMYLAYVLIRPYYRLHKHVHVHP